MSVDEIKKGLAALPEAQQMEVTAFLFHLRHLHDREYEETVSGRLADKEKTHWLRPDDFEKKLDQQ